MNLGSSNDLPSVTLSMAISIQPCVVNLAIFILEMSKEGFQCINILLIYWEMIKKYFFSAFHVPFTKRNQ